MDLHIVPGVSAKDVAEAHVKDLNIQTEFGCNCMTYWIDESRGSVFCLIEAPTAEAVSELHKKSHGLVPHNVVEVSKETVDNFLGRLIDPKPEYLTEGGLKVFSDSAFRILVSVHHKDNVLMSHKLSKGYTSMLMNMLVDTISSFAAKNNGTIVQYPAPYNLISFKSIIDALNFSKELCNQLTEEQKNVLGFKLGINAGEPLDEDGNLFSKTIKFFDDISFLDLKERVVVTPIVKKMNQDKILLCYDEKLKTLTSEQCDIITKLNDILEISYTDSDFKIPQWAKQMTTSTSGLFRMVNNLTDDSPISLLKNFRLKKSLEILKTNTKSISEIAFSCGFSSPAYFTKCFTEAYNISPSDYKNILLN